MRNIKNKKIKLKKSRHYMILTRAEVRSLVIELKDDFTSRENELVLPTLRKMMFFLEEK